MALTTDWVTAAGIAKLFRDNIWRNHGLPDTIISNRDPCFLADFSHELNKLLGIDTQASTAFHPQTDGQTEQVNQDLEAYLCAFINMWQMDWPEWLPMFEFTYNNRTHSATGTSPFKLDTRMRPCMGFEPHRKSLKEAPQEFKERMQQVLEDAQAAMNQASRNMSRSYNL